MTRVWIGTAGVVIILSFALLSAFWTPYNPNAMNIQNRLEGPSRDHLLGTDQFGRDLFSRLLVATRNALMVGGIALSVAVTFGSLVGFLSAYISGLMDELLMRFMDAVYSMPALILAMLMTAILGPGIKNAIIAIGIFNIPVFARLTRSSLLSIQQEEYLVAAHSLGISKSRLVLKYLLPNAGSPLVVQSSNSVAKALLAEAGLSYLGLGTQPPHPSWGMMLKSAQTFTTRSLGLVLFPGLALILTVFSFNILADGLRDLLDPLTTKQF